MNRSRSPVLSQMKFHQAQTIRKAELMAEDPHCAICRSELVARYGASNSAVLADGVLKCSSCIELLSTPKPRIPRIAGEVHEMTAEQVKARNVS